MSYPDDPGGTPLTPEEMMTKSMPTDVAAWWTSLNILGEFTIEIERAKGAGGVEKLPPVTNRVPAQSEIGEQYGPGKYRLMVTYHPSGWKEGKNQTVAGPWFELSEDGYQDLHDDYKDRQRSKRSAKQPNVPQAAPGASNALGELAPLVQVLAQALRPQAAPAAAPVQPDNSVMVALINSSNESNKLMMTMMMKSMELTVNMLASSKKDDHGMEGAFDKFIGLMEKSMDVRDRLMTSPVKDEPSMLDKLMDGIGQILPHVGMMLSMPKMARDAMVPAVLSKQPVEVQQGVELLQSDASFRNKVIAKAQESYGDQAAEVLEALEIIAPLKTGEKV